MSAPDSRTRITPDLPEIDETAWRLRPRRADFVAELTGVPLSRPLTSAEVDALQACWTRYPVLILPGQPLEHRDYERFAAQFGAFGPNPYLRAVDDHAHIVEVRREADETTPIFGASWHSDWSFLPTPPGATLLHAKAVPPRGGDTCFADTTHAYAALPERLRDRIETLRAVHTASPSYGPNGLFARDDPSRSMRIVVSPRAEETVVHPVVRTHPESGRRSLYINHVYTVAIEGMPAAAGRALLETLFAHMTGAEFVYRHRWQRDTLVIWDNRCVIHYADGGYEGHQRIMHRITLAGEPPV